MEPRIIQLIFEFYCLELKAGPIPINDFIHTLEDGFGWMKLKFKNYILNEPTLKAIACVIPFMVNVKEVEFQTNGIQDHLSCALILACYMNPTIDSFKMDGNPLRGASVNTMNEMVKHFPTKKQTMFLVGSY